MPDPVFPPLLTGHAVKAPQRPFGHACRQAAAGALGAGDIVWSRNTARAECALVLEPEVALAAALQMVPLAEVALADGLGGLCPPQVAVTHRWPGGLLVNGATAGRFSAGAAAAPEAEPPPWLVVGFHLDLRFDAAGREPGEAPDATALHEEGAGEVTRTDVLQSFAAHFLTWLTIWQDEGFRPVHDQWMLRLADRGQPAAIEHEGERLCGRILGLDEAAGLLLKPDDAATRLLRLVDSAVWHRGSGAP